jgi:hypothetical protein
MPCIAVIQQHNMSGREEPIAYNGAFGIFFAASINPGHLTTRISRKKLFKSICFVFRGGLYRFAGYNLPSFEY